MKTTPKKLTIAGPWTYRTALVTVDYGPGEHEVSTEIAAKFKEETDGNGAATPAAPVNPDAA